MKKKFAIILAVALLCVLAVTAALARDSIAGFFAPETTTGFYEPYTQGIGPPTAGWAPPAYAIHGVTLRAQQYLPETKELLVTIENSSGKELLWTGNQVSDYLLLYWDGAVWDFVQLEEPPQPHPHNIGALPAGEEITVTYALKHYPTLQEGTRYRIAVWIKDPGIPEDQGFINSYQIDAEFELPL